MEKRWTKELMDRRLYDSDRDTVEVMDGWIAFDYTNFAIQMNVEATNVN